MLIAISPIKIPIIFPTTVLFPRYNLLDSGVNSPDTIYIIAPAANAKHNPIMVSDIPPKIAPTKAPSAVVTPDKITYHNIFLIFIPPFFNGTAIASPSGISWKQIVIARDKPSLIDDSNPDPMANPSGKLCIASPTLMINPVFNRFTFELSTVLIDFETKLSTYISHIIITIIPNTIPIITFAKFDISKASGISSKHIIDVIRPDVNAKMKPKNLLLVFFIFTPINPPKVVPKVPKNKPNNAVFIISSIYITSFYIFLQLLNLYDT